MRADSSDRGPLARLLRHVATATLGGACVPVPAGDGAAPALSTLPGILRRALALSLGGACVALGAMACAEDARPAAPEDGSAPARDAAPDGEAEAATDGRAPYVPSLDGAGASLCGVDLLEPSRAAAGFDSLGIVRFERRDVRVDEAGAPLEPYCTDEGGGFVLAPATSLQAGRPCATATDEAACRARVETRACASQAASRDAVAQIVATRGDTVLVIPFVYVPVGTSSDLRAAFEGDPFAALAALAPIRSAAQAALHVALARDGGTSFVCDPAKVCHTGVRAVAARVDEGDVVVSLLESPMQSCPVDDQLTHRIDYRVAADGTATTSQATVHAGCDRSRGPRCGRAFEGEAPYPLDAGEGEAEPRAAARLARAAYFEAGSVTSFRRLARELRAHGAPAELVARARKAARDEIRHARVTEGLARRFGADDAALRRPRAGAMPVRPLRDVARENAVEGCVNEAFAAALALVQADRAADPGVRSALGAIAADEVGHATLAWDVAAWATSRLDAADRLCVDTARSAALAELAANEGADGADDAAVRSPLGLPTRAEARALALATAAALAAHAVSPLGRAA